jgi:hypothetical protein
MNSNFRQKVVNDNLRYIDWVSRNGNNPANLDDSDYNKIVTSDSIFARKFEYPRAIGIVNSIKKLAK